jgi:hypothetical protein
MSSTITKGNYQFRSEYITFSINVNVGSLSGTTIIQTMFYLVPRCLEHVWCYRNHNVSYAGF